MKNPHLELTTKNLVQQRPRRPNSNSRTALTALWRIEILLRQRRNPLALRPGSEMETMKAEGSRRRRSRNDHNPATNLLEKAPLAKRRTLVNEKNKRERLRKMGMRTQGKAFRKRHKTKGKTSTRTWKREKAS